LVHPPALVGLREENSREVPQGPPFLVAWDHRINPLHQHASSQAKEREDGENHDYEANNVDNVIHRVALLWRHDSTAKVNAEFRPLLARGTKSSLAALRCMSILARADPRPQPSLSQAVQQMVGRELRILLHLGSEALPQNLEALIGRLHQVLGGTGPGSEFRDQLLEAVPRLRAFAVSLTRHREDADDLVQETIVKAWGAFDRFQPGTNLNAWLFTILRNQFHTNHRKSRREVEDSDGKFAARLKSLPEQDGKVALHELQVALDKLAPDQREALVLVGVERVSYEDAAAICGVPVGTIKSRVNRARSKLAELLGISTVSDLGADRTVRAALGG
jgi:RNA polymerase sigma-70 factor, ECF subfamily